MSDGKRSPTLTIGPWEVDPVGLRLHQGGEEARLQPRTMRLLLALAEARGEAVTKDWLSDAVWGEEGASDDLLARHVSMIRQALGDDARKPRWLETIPRVGYRLRCDWREPPSPVESAPPAPRRRWLIPAATALTLGLTVLLAVAVLITRPAAPTLRNLGTSLPLSDTPSSGGDVTASGDLVAFVEATGAALDGPLRLLDPSAARLQTIAPGPARFPSLAPAGDALAFFEPGPPCHLVVVSLPQAAGVPGSRFPCAGTPTSPVGWLDDGAIAVGWGRASGRGTIERIEPASGSRELVAEVRGVPGFPAQVPGKALLFAVEAGGDSALYRLRNDAAEPEVLARLAPRRIRWLDVDAATGTLLAVASDRLGRFVLFEGDLEGGPWRRVGAATEVQSAAYAGGAVVYARAAYRRTLDLSRIDARGRVRSEELRLPDPTAARIMVSPDGTRLAYLTEASQGNALRLFEPGSPAGSRLLAGSVLEELLDHPTWEEDGRHLLFTSASPGGARVRRVEVSDGSIVLDVAAPEPVHGIHVRTGRVVLETRGDDRIRLRDLDLATGRIGDPVTIPGLSAQPAGEPGSYLFATADGTLSAWRADVGGAAATALMHIGAPTGWLIRDGEILFACPDGDRPARLCRADLASRRGTVLTGIRFSPPLLSASRDLTVLVTGRDEDLRLAVRRARFETISGDG